jgi:hypothetical protein
MSWSLYIDTTPREKMSQAIADALPSPHDPGNIVQRGQIDAAKAAAQALLSNMAGVIQGRQPNDLLRCSITGHASNGDSPDYISAKIEAVRTAPTQSAEDRARAESGATPTTPPAATPSGATTTTVEEEPPATGTGAEKDTTDQGTDEKNPPA